MPPTNVVSDTHHLLTTRVLTYCIPLYFSHLDQAAFGLDCQKVDPGHHRVLCCHSVKSKFELVTGWLDQITY